MLSSLLDGYWVLILGLRLLCEAKDILLYWVTQENSIEFLSIRCLPLYTNYWWSALHSFSSTIMTMYLPQGWHVLTMPYNIIVARTFYVVPLCHVRMWLWLWHVMLPFVFSKKNKIKPSPLFTTLTILSFRILFYQI